MQNNQQNYLKKKLIINWITPVKLTKQRNMGSKKNLPIYLLLILINFSYLTVGYAQQAPTLINNGSASNHSINVEENNTYIIIDYDATDPEGELEGTGVSQELDYTLTGIDAAFFSIQDNGLLFFNTPPDFATPLDDNMDNSYELRITVMDSEGLMDFQDLTVIVTLQNPEPSIPCEIIAAEIGSLDRMHFIPPVYATSGLSTGTDIDDHYLWLSTPQVTPMTVTIQNADGFNGLPGGINETVTIDRNNPALITLSAGIYGSANFGALGIVDDSGLNTVNTTDGLILTSPNKFYANIRQSSNSQGGSLTAKGQVGLGIRFRSGHLHMTANSAQNKKSHFISVMASEDNTTVNFSEIAPGITFVGGNPSTVVLNQYESYTVGVKMDQGNNDQFPNDLNGTLITANRAIVVNSGSFLGGAIINTENRDLGMDQIVPTKYLGTQFILVKGTATSNADVLETPIVIADADNTAIFLNGSPTPIATINAGDYYIVSGNEYPANGTMSIRTSQPVYVYQTTNANDQNGNGLNYIAAIFPDLEVQDLLIPQIDQLGAATLNFVAPDNAVVSLNNTPLSGGIAVPGINGFLLYSISGMTGDMYVNSTEPYFLSLTTEAGVRGSAGYFVGFPNSYAIRDRKTAAPYVSTSLDLMVNDVLAGLEFSINAICEQPKNGTVSIESDSTVTYIPNPGFFGIDTFKYNIVSTTGITDASFVYVAIDTDGDGIGDVTDIDIDNDGIPNVDEPGDTDMDNIVDAYDLDSDNDGIYDLIEAGHGALDNDNNGRVDDVTGNNGLLDLLETTPESSILNYTIANTDLSDTPDFIDLNSDNDGCLDVNEAGFSDEDDNGLLGSGSFGMGLTVDMAGKVISGIDGYTLPTSTNTGIFDFQDAAVNTCSEICGNGRDDDDNGLIDNADPVCQSTPELIFSPIITTENTPFNGCGIVVDSNLVDTHTVQVCSPAVNGVAIPLVDNTTSQLCINYTPNTGYVGLDSVCVIICDQTGLCDTTTIPILVEASITHLKLSVLLQGALLGSTDTLMRDDLRKQNLIPLTQPYVDSLGTSRFTHIGGGGMETTNLSILADKPDTSNAIVDWVFIELRDALDSTSVLRTIAALVQRDGDIVNSATGDSLFATSLPSNCFVAIKHRNHLGVMTATPVSITNEEIAINFTSISNLDLFHLNSYDGLEQSQLNGKKALWAANSVIDNQIKQDGIGNDRIQIVQELISHEDNATPSLNFNGGIGYFFGDIDMDGYVKYVGSNNDYILLQNILLSHPLNTAKLTNFSLLREQLPE